MHSDSGGDARAVDRAAYFRVKGRGWAVIALAPSREAVA
jgi:hypothetical protein